MSFSFRSLFQRGADSNESGHNAPQHFARTPTGMTGLPPISKPVMQASLQPSATSPFQMAGSPLFKTTSNEPITAPPINSAMGISPFNIAGATPTNAPLTVGDVIHQLPPEVVRAGALPIEQPLSLPPALLENALRSGQAALPVFELYRVCPALFQTPISPQDPRVVPLPASKLPGLIARAREGQAQSVPASPQASSPSPFAVAQSAPAASPFQMAAPEAPPPAPAFPMSPFAVAAPGRSPNPEPAPSPPQSPFSIKPAAEAAPASPFSVSKNAASPSPFTMNDQARPQPLASPAQGAPPPITSGSPFGMMPQNASPFSATPPPPPESPFAATSAPSPFAQATPPLTPQASISSLFTPKSQEQASTPVLKPAEGSPMPFGSPFAAAMKEGAPQAAPSPQPMFASAAAPTPSASSGAAKLSFAAVLGGYSLEELGFNPAMVPAWINTSLPASTLNEQIPTGQVIIQLGALIDGITDVGFRNTLVSAKRDFSVKLPQNEVFHALTNAASAPASAAPMFAASAPSASQQPPASNAFVIQPGAPAGQVSRVEAAPPSFAAPTFQTIAPQQQPPLQSMFAAAAAPKEEAPPAPVQPSSSPFASMQASGLNPFAQAQESPPQAMPSGSVPSAFGMSPPAPAAPQQPSPSLFATPRAPSAPLQPLAGAIQPFGSSMFGGQAPSQPTAAPTTKPFDPFASAGALAPKPQAESGFSSAQLLGQAPSHQPAPPVFAPAPEIKPVSRLFSPPAAEPATSFAPALEESQPPPAPEPQRQPAPVSFSAQPASVPLFSIPAPQSKPLNEPKPAPMPPPAPVASAPAKMAPVKHSFLGLSPVDTQTDQLLLRALLGTEENLAAPRVVELLASQQGLSACVCLHGSHVLSHADATKEDASEFQRQAPDIARQLRGLAPLIGIDGAETFTLNAGGRLLTFCFPGSTTVAVLHDAEPSTGLRDKITLIARELARMLG